MIISINLITPVALCIMSIIQKPVSLIILTDLQFTSIKLISQVGILQTQIKDVLQY